MSQCTKCGARFIGTAQNPPADGLCKYCEIEGLKSYVKNLRIALEESVKLQSFYGQLLNTYDGGERMKFDNADDWLMRLQQTGTLP